MDLEYGVRKWPQQSNYRTNLEFLSSCSYSRINKPKPLDQKYYDRYEAFSLKKETIEKELELVATKVAKAEADLTVADTALNENKWSKAASKMSNAQRLKNVLAEVKKAEALVTAKLHSMIKENSCLTEIIRLQESMEQTYQESISRR